MADFHAEMSEKAKAVKNAGELLALAEENNHKITAEEAAAFFERIHANCLDDDLLEGVSGG